MEKGVRAMNASYGKEPSLAHEEPPPYSPVRGNSQRSTGCLDGKQDDGIIVQIARTWTRTVTKRVAPRHIARTTSNFLRQRTWPTIRDTTTSHVTPLVSSTSRATWGFLQDRMWRHIRDYPLKATQFWALLLLALGIGPFVSYGTTNQGWHKTFYYGAFAAKTMGCGDALGVPQNSTVEGIEALFVLDWTFGQFSFARVKTIDVAWDILIGRGVQMIFWAISYRVFSDALLRLIERHPASFETFKSISLEGPGLGSFWILLKQLLRKKSKRTWFLFLYLLLASLYVLSIPPLLGAMTGYDGTTIAWVSIGDTDNIIPSSQMQPSYIVYGTYNQSFEQPMCDTTTGELRDWYYHQQDMEMYCDCQLPNGTILPYSKWQYSYNSFYYDGESPTSPYKLDDCSIRFPNQSGVYQSTWGQDSGYERATNWGKFNCNDTFPVTLPNGKTYSIHDINFAASGFCFQNKTYAYGDLVDTTRCLPDTAHPSYQWGFSSAMMGVILIINLVWCLTMWIVWQDALKAKLVRSGYRMSPLRAAFVLTEAARWRIGIGVDDLILRERKTLKRELRRDKGRGEAMVDRAIFDEGGRECSLERGKGVVVTITRRPIMSRKKSSIGPPT